MNNWRSTNTRRRMPSEAGSSHGSRPWCALKAREFVVSPSQFGIEGNASLNARGRLGLTSNRTAPTVRLRHCTPVNVPRVSPETFSYCHVRMRLPKTSKQPESGCFVMRRALTSPARNGHFLCLPWFCMVPIRKRLLRKHRILRHRLTSKTPVYAETFSREFSPEFVALYLRQINT